MKIVNTQCSIIIVAVVVLRWSAFTSSYLLSPNSCCQVLLCRSSDQCHSGCTLVTNRTQISIRNGRTSMLRRASCMASLPRKKDVRAWCDGWATPKDTSWGCNMSWIQCLAWAIPSGVKASACDGSTSDNTRPMHRPSGSCRSKSLSHDVVAIGLVGKGSHDATMESGLARVSRYLKFCGVQTCNGLIWNRNDDSLLVLVVGWQLLLDGDCWFPLSDWASKWNWETSSFRNAAGKAAGSCHDNRCCFHGCTQCW